MNLIIPTQKVKLHCYMTNTTVSFVREAKVSNIYKTIAAPKNDKHYNLPFPRHYSASHGAT
jgi:hypothetical protein